MLHSRVRAAVTRRRPPRAALALAVPVALAGLLLGPVSPARAAGTLLYVPNPSANMVSVVDTSSDTDDGIRPAGSFTGISAAPAVWPSATSWLSTCAG